MIAIGSYFVFITYTIGMIFAATHFSPEEKNQFYEYILHEHNEYREKHGVDDLRFNGLMFTLARSTVCEYMDDENLKKKGANCFSKDFDTSSKLDAELAAEVVAEWYNKGQDYNYEEEPSSVTADAFTQIVWMNTEFIGVEFYVESNKFYIAVHYFPEGNQTNKYKKNVIPPKKRKAKT